MITSMDCAPFRLNRSMRPSRLFRSTFGYVVRQAVSIIRVFILYKPFRFFTALALIVGLPGVIGIIRFLAFYAAGDGGGHIQSLILAAVLFIVGFQIMVLGLVADVISFNRRLIEETLYRTRRIELDHMVNNEKEKMEDRQSI